MPSGRCRTALSRGTTLRRSPCCIATTPPAGGADRRGHDHQPTTAAGAAAGRPAAGLRPIRTTRRGGLYRALPGMPGSRLAPAWAFPDRLLADRGCACSGSTARLRPIRSAPGPARLGSPTTWASSARSLAWTASRCSASRSAPPSPWPAPSAFPSGWVAAAPSPMGPWGCPRPRAGMSRRNRRYFTLAPRAPVLGRAACWLWARMALAGLRGDRDRLRRLSKGLPPPDQQVLAEVAADPQRWALRGGHRRGVPPGWRRVRADLAVASQPWGFQLQQVSVPTWLWHGAADEDVPIVAARRIAQLMPNCQASFTHEGT